MASIRSLFLNSESTGFQPVIDQNIHKVYSENIKTHLSACPRKLTSVMDIQRQRFSQLNPRFKQQQRRSANFLQQTVICPVILPSASRPQPRQQARSKQPQFSPASIARRSNTAHVKHQEPSSASNRQYITLANLTKILHVLQTQEKIIDSESSTDTSASTSNSAKQRVKQHLQETATRWWKPIRSSDCHQQVPAPSSIHTYATPTQLPSSAVLQQSDNLPLLTIVSNSTQRLNISAFSSNRNSKYDESESSTEVQATTVTTSIAQTTNTKRTRQEPLIMQPRGMRLQSHDHPYYNNHNNMNFFQQQRLIRQT